MKNDYISMMQRNENMVMAYVMKARQEKLRAGGHTKAECVYLQEAAKLRGEMARMSMGAERAHQDELRRELDSEIRMIVAELSPEVNEDDKKKDEPADSKPSGGGSQTQASGSEAISDDTVKKWFVKDTSHGFDAVAGMGETVAKLRSCINETRHNALRNYLKMSNTHGFLLFGPPGCGKTFIANAFAHELLEKDYKFMRLVGADILSKYVGEAESIIKRVFEEAIKNAPCIVFIDEIDSLCKNRSMTGLPEYASSLTTAFLNGFNTITDRSGDNADKTIIFIGATNYPNNIDDAMIDRVELVRIPLPDEESRASAFEYKLRGIIQSEDDFSFVDMARLTSGYNRRDIDRLVEAIFHSVLLHMRNRDDKEAIEMIQSGEYRLTRELFTEAQEECIISPKDNIAREQEEWEKRLRMQKD